MKIYILLLFLACVSNYTFAKIWTVDNTGKVADYNNILSAIAAASDGDTLLLGGGGGVYSDITLTKRLCIIGTGYFLTENPNTVENKGQVTFNDITLSSGSEGSIIVGVVTNHSMTISSDGNVVKRCYLFSSGNNLSVSGNNNIIKQCFLRNPYSSNNIVIYITGSNNILRNCYSYKYSGGYSLFSNAGNIIENNIFEGNINVTASTFGNNIQVSGSASFTNCNPYNNIGNDIQFGSLNGNKSFINMSTVFVSSGTTDGKWQLSATSPAKGAGWGGVDCGMFGGTDPYVLSGLPEVPVITSITVPSRATPTNGLNIQINVQSKK